MPVKATNQLYSSDISGATGTGMNQINTANAQNVSDINAISSSLQDAISKGLGLYLNNNSQSDYNNIMNTSNNLINNGGYSAGNVDLSGYQPYMNTGALASAEAAKLAGLGPDAYNSQQIYDRYLNNPATQFQMEQGNRQINSNAAAKGMLGSGSILKALQSYGQGIASQGLGTAQQNLYNLAGQGANAANAYAASLLNKYSTDVQAASAAKQNQTNLLGQQVNALGNNYNAANSQLGFLQSLSNTGANIQAQAANQRQSSLIGGAQRFQDKYGTGYGGIQSNLNTNFSYSS